MKMKFLQIIFLLIGVTIGVAANGKSTVGSFAESKILMKEDSTVLKPNSLEQDFAFPPVSTKPFVYWYWISNNISKDGIQKDLESMAKIGIGGVNIAQIEYVDSPKGSVQIFSDEWWDCLTFAMEEAARLGIEVNLFNSPGWSGTGGSWIKPEQAMRYLDVHEFRVKGPQKLMMHLSDYASKELVPQKSLSFAYNIDKSTFKFQQVAVQAFPVPWGSDDLISGKKPMVTSKPEIKGAEVLFDGSEATKASFFRLPTTIELNLKELFTARSLEIIPAEIPATAWCKLDYLNDKGDWITVTSCRILRGETRIIASGFMPFAPVSITFPPVRAKKFRITFSENENTSSSSQNGSPLIEKIRLSEIRLGSAPTLNNYAEKQMANKASYQKSSPEDFQQNDTSYAVKKDKVLDITSHVDKNGLLSWDVPEGDWIIQHAGMSQTGVQTHPVPSVEVMGFAADILSKYAVQSSFDAYIGQILKRIPPEKRKTLTRVVLDSYEQGSANWTDGMAQKFIEAYGYDPMPWTPVLKGHIVESNEQSERFLWDLRRLVADLIPDNFPGAIREKSKENGFTLWHEPYAGHGFPGEFMNLGKYTDMPAGEFWMAKAPGSDFSSCRAGTSVANVYGKSIVSAEAFTSSGNFLYKMLPRDLKMHGDWAFAQGINHFTFHVSVHQPTDNKPGINTWYGTEFNRNNNWLQDAKTYIDYIKRCTALLQRGQRQTDVAIYTGDDVPNDKPTLPYPLPSGFDLDFVNYDALLNLAKVENGKLVFPSGATYKLLILPNSKWMRPELLSKLEEFVNAGLIVYGPRPMKSPGLKDFPHCDKSVQDIANRLWGKIDEKKNLSNSYGKGKVFFGLNLADLFSAIGLKPAVTMPENFVFTHRKEDDTDIFFIANQKEQQCNAEISFRVENKQPELWDALTGERRKLNSYTVKNGRTIIPLEFVEAGSCFVVFRNRIEAQDVNKKNYPVYSEKQTLSGKWNLTFSSAVNPPFHRTLENLADWTTFDDKDIKYFCGTATYTIHFNFNGKLPDKWFINLGKVESLAKIRLNGKEVNTLWCYPYRAEISEYLVNGLNKLEVDIVNQWWNQLVGDEQPGAIRRTYVSARLFWKADDELVPSGMLGPVVLENIKY